MKCHKRQPLGDSERRAAAKTAPRKTVEKLFVLQAALADPATAKTDCVVLAVLLEAQNKTHGYSWPAIATIAATAEFTPRAVQKALGRLERLGYIVVDPGGAGPKSSNHYFVRPVKPGPEGHPRVNERAPLSLVRRAATDHEKGESEEPKDEELEQTRVNSGSPDPSYEPTDNLNPSATPAARAHDCAHAAQAAAEQEAVNSPGMSGANDPLSSLPKNHGAFLARVERRLKHGPPPSRVEVEAWLANVELLAFENTSVGGRANRLCEALSDYLEQQAYRRRSVVELRREGYGLGSIARMSGMCEDAVMTILREDAASNLARHATEGDTLMLRGGHASYR